MSSRRHTVVTEVNMDAAHVGVRVSVIQLLELEQDLNRNKMISS